MELMSERQWKRWDAVARVAAGKMTMQQAATVLGLTVRQVRRIRRRVEQQGRAGLAHGNRGRRPVNKLAPAVQARVLALRQTRYVDFNDVHFVEKLATEAPPLVVSVRTVRRLLRPAGIGAMRQRRAPKHRRRRARKAQAGLMLLWDGSRHAWLETRGPSLCLMAAVDDATGELLPGAHFVTQECAAGYLRVLEAVVRAYGVPWSVYMDQHGALKRNDDHWTVAEERRGVQDPTQVGTALAALGIEAIYALSPQAKGRVERLWGTLQDRLVSELRLAGARTLADAERGLAAYRAEHNRRFAIAAAERTPAWRPLRRGVDLARLCSFRYEATVGKDNAVRLGGVILDIPPGPRRRGYADEPVEVRQLLDGSWRIYWRDTLIATAAATASHELRALKRRKHGRGAPESAPAPTHFVEAST
ncbi:MAG: ISNCY family transposase [Pseudomonadota bacterium]